MQDEVEQPASASIWAHKKFRIVLVSTVVSLLGSATVPVALAFAVLNSGGGALGLGTVLALNSLPAIIFLVAGGIAADRFSRARILVYGRVLAGAVDGLAGVVVATSHATVPTLSAFSLAAGVVSAFTLPASQGLIPLIVPREFLQQANTLVRLPMNAVQIGGPAVGGLVVGLMGPAWGFALSAFTLAFSGLILRGVVLPEAERRTTSVLGDLKSGWIEFRTTTWLWIFTVSGTAVVMFWLAGFQLLGPVVTKQSYGGAEAWGLVQGSFAGGMLLGSSVSLRWRPYRLLAVSVAGNLGLALPLLTMGARAPLAVVAAAALLAGVLLDVAIVCWSTLSQMHLPSESLGRLLAFNGVGERVAIPVGYMLAAVAATKMSSTSVQLLCGGVIGVTTLATLAIPKMYSINRTIGTKALVADPG